jgi:hypothetical protein
MVKSAERWPAGGGEAWDAEVPVRGDRYRDRERVGMCRGIEKAEGNLELLCAHAFYS